MPFEACALVLQCNSILFYSIRESMGYTRAVLLASTNLAKLGGSRNFSVRLHFLCQRCPRDNTVFCLPVSIDSGEDGKLRGHLCQRSTQSSQSPLQSILLLPILPRNQQHTTESRSPYCMQWGLYSLPTDDTRHASSGDTQVYNTMRGRIHSFAPSPTARVQQLCISA